jgi:hypothetical protein
MAMKLALSRPVPGPRPVTELTSRLFRGFAPMALTSVPVAGIVGAGRRWWRGRSSTDVSRLFAHTLHSGCPAARHPFGVRLNPQKCAAVRR